MKLAMSIDVEDWFHVENLKSEIKRESWNLQESRVTKNVMHILELLNNNNTLSTFFVLGWIAKRYPNLIKEISKNGHEIGCHGYGHELIYNLSIDSFRNDILKSKTILEDLTGKNVLGYRAPSFSITDWAIDILYELGFKYDSSSFPTLIHDRYGKLLNKGNSSSQIIKLKNSFYLIQLSCLKILGKNIPWSGGGYFRLIPYPVFKYGLKRILKKDDIFVFYIHPWEFDINQPRINNIKLTYKFRHYNNLSKTTPRFKELLKDFKFTSIEKIMQF